jgi:hypothetical protein
MSPSPAFTSSDLLLCLGHAVWGLDQGCVHVDRRCAFHVGTGSIGVTDKNLEPACFGPSQDIPIRDTAIFIEG